MNIGIFTDTFFPQISGVSTSVKMLEKELSKRGHKIYIFTTSDPQADTKVPRLFRLPSMPFVFVPKRRLCLMYPPKLIMNMKKFELDVVHTQTEFPLGIFGKLVSDFYKIPHIHTYHTMYEDYVHYFLNGHLITPKMAQLISRTYCNRANEVITPGDKTKEYLESIGVTRPISTIPTGIDFAPFSRERYTQDEINALKAELGLDPSAPTIVTVGRVAKEKSIDVLIKQMPKLLKLLPHAKFVIVGGGPAREELAALANSLEISASVIFTGEKPWEEIGKYYRLGDVFAMASTSETQGLTCFEAMAARVPLVVKRDRSVEGVVLHGETGYCFDSDDEAPGLLYRALTNREEANALSESGFLSIERFSAGHFAERVEVLYEEALTKYGRSARKLRKRQNRGQE